MRIYANILAVRRSWVRKFRSKKDLFFQWSLKTKYSKTFCGPQMFYWFATNERTIVINEYIFWMFWVFFIFSHASRQNLLFAFTRDIGKHENASCQGILPSGVLWIYARHVFYDLFPKKSFMLRWKSTVFCIKNREKCRPSNFTAFFFFWLTWLGKGWVWRTTKFTVFSNWKQQFFSWNKMNFHSVNPKWQSWLIFQEN